MSAIDALCAANRAVSVPWSPADLIQIQLDAYNSHDVEALLACYDAQAQQFEFADRPLAQGHADLRERMTARFAASRPVATLLHRTVLGMVVIDHERIVNQSAQGETTVRELVAIYEVEGPRGAGLSGDRGRIVRARFIFGEERPA